MIGADGVHSAVREHVLGPGPQNIRFEKMVAVYGTLRTSSVVAPQSDFRFPAAILSPAGFLSATPIDTRGTLTAWSIAHKNVETERTPRELQDAERAADAVRAAKAVFDGVKSDLVRSLLDRSEIPSARIWQVYSIPEIPTCHTSRVCLIGDAAHAMAQPGIGTSLAFEDAAILSSLLGHGFLGASEGHDRLFRRYEGIRRPRLKLYRDGPVLGTFEGTCPPFLVSCIKAFIIRPWRWWNGLGTGPDADALPPKGPNAIAFEEDLIMCGREIVRAVKPDKTAPLLTALPDCRTRSDPVPVTSPNLGALFCGSGPQRRGGGMFCERRSECTLVNDREY